MIDLELRAQIDMALRSAEPALAFRALADAATRRAATIIPNTKAAAYQHGRARGLAKAFLACAEVDGATAADTPAGLEVVIE